MSFCPNYNDPKYMAVVDVLKDPVKAYQYYNNYNGDLDTLYRDIVEPQYETMPGMETYVKEGVKNIFESNPELASIGTQEEYSQYLDTVFPDSQVQDIVYHGTSSDFVEFTDAQKGRGAYGKAIYFTNDKRAAYDWSQQYDDISFVPQDEYDEPSVRGKVVSAIVNAVNPQEINQYQDSLSDEVDSGIVGNNDEVLVKKADQVLVLGSKQDVEGFRQFMASEKKTTSLEAIRTESIAGVDAETKAWVDNIDEIESYLSEFIDGNEFDYGKFLETVQKQKYVTPSTKLYAIMNTLIGNIWNKQASTLNLRIKMVADLPGTAAGTYTYQTTEYVDNQGKIVRITRTNHVISISLKKTVAELKAILMSERAILDKDYMRSRFNSVVSALINHELLHSLHPLSLGEIPMDRFEEFVTNGEDFAAVYTADERAFVLGLYDLYKTAEAAGITKDQYYGMTNMAEFFTEAMTNINFQYALAQIQYKTSKKTVWKKFVDMLQKYFKHFFKIDMKGSVLEEALNQIASFIESNRYTGRFRTIIVNSSGVSTATVILPSMKVGDQTISKPDKNLKKEFLKLVKLSKKEISGLQKNMVLSRLKTANMKLNTRFRLDFRKVGEADLYRWEVVDLLAPAIPEKPAEPTRPDSPAVQMTMNFYESRGTNDPSMNDWENPTTAAFVLSPAIYDDINNVSDVNTPSIQAMGELARVLSASIAGTPYQFITQREAEQMLGPGYRNQAGYFYNGTAYYVIDKITPEVVFHEMGHPFVKAIAYYNPELFEQLYQSVMATPEGAGIYQEILGEKYDVTEGSDRFKEEVIVRALQAKFRMENFQQKPSAGFAKVIKDILYAIKKILRQIFGKKIDISKLDVNTTLDQLITMLEKGGEFNIDRSVVTTQDIESYMNNNKQFVEEISLLEQNAQQAILRLAYDTVVKHITLLKENKNYEALFEVLKDEFNETELDAIKQNLSKHVDIINKRATEFLETAEQVNARATALVNSIHRLNKVMMRFDEHMDDLVNNIDDPANGLRAYYYGGMAKYYKQFVDTLIKDMQGVVPVEASVRSLINQLNTRIDNVLSKTALFDQKVSTDAIANELQFIGQAINEKYEEIIKDLEERGRKRNEDPKKYVDAWYKEWKGMTKEDYEEYQMLSKLERPSLKQLERLAFLQRESFKGAEITREKIELALKGMSPDANPFSSFLEGYLYNPDIVVGTFALYLKNATTEYLTNAQSKMNDFFREVYPLMEAAGFDPNKTDEFFEQITALQDFGALREGEMVKKTVNSFLSLHGGNYRWERDSRRNQVTSAEADYSFERTEDKRLAFAKAVKALRDWENKYMHQPYHPYFYKRYELFTDDEIGIEASARYEEAIQELGAYEYSIFSEDQYIDTTVQREAVRLKYKQLFSRYKNGVKKEGFELLVTERLIAFKEKTKELYEWNEKPGAFMKALHKYQQELIDQGIEKYDAQGNPNPLFRSKTQMWIEANTVIKNKESYYERRQILINRYKEIMDLAGKDVKDSVDISKLFGDLIDLSRPHKGDEGEIEASGMTEAEIKTVKELEEKIEEMKQNLRKASGLTQAQSERLTELVLKAKALKGTGQRMDPWESMEMNQLFDITKKNLKAPLSDEMKEELTTIFILLGEMTKYEPTMDYMDQLNEIIHSDPEIEKYLKSIGKVNQYGQIIEYTPNSVESLFTYNVGDMVIMDLKRISPRFKEWFDKNHIVKKRYDPLSKTRKQLYERLYVWSVSRPSSDEDLQDMVVTEEDGYSYPIKRVPSIRYYKRKVKDNITIINENGVQQTITLKTPEIVGVTKDNRKQWLPRADVPNSPFIDERYVKLRDSKSAGDKALFDALEALKEYHLKIQEGLSYHSKLYLDVPRYSKENLDVLRTRKKRAKAIKDGTNAPPEDEKVGGIIQLMIDRAKQFIYGVKDAPELDGTGAQSNYEKNTMILVRMDTLDNDINDIPIGGLYDIEHYDVSTDIGKSILRYMLSTERHKKLLEISPVAQAIQNTVKENRPNPKNEINKQNLLYRSVISLIRPKDVSVREKAINNLIDREFKGQIYTGWGSDEALVNNLANFTFKMASFGFFALNIPSALKNMITPKFQGMINAAGGDFMNFRNQAAGEAWAFKTMGQMSMEIYQPKAHSLDLQLVEIMDLVPNRFVEKMGERASRTMLRDTVGTRGLNFGWLYNFRKWTETQSTLALSGGMMDKQMVKTKDGSEMKFIDAWELNDQGKIQTRSNVDPEWSMTYDENGNVKVGKEFKRFKNLVQQAGSLFQGSYAQFEQPEMQRYLLGRYIGYMKKYFTPNLIARWGFQGDFGNVRPRFNAGLGNVHMGYYVSTLRSLQRIIKTRGGWMHYMTPQEKADALKTLTEVVIAMLLLALLGPLFGWDPDDEEKYEKLKRKSGPLPLPGVTEDPRYPFDTMGFVENHALLLMMQLRNENEQFIPWPNYGLDDYVGVLNLKSIAMDPTFKKGEDIITMLLAQVQDDPSAYYKRSIGPYAWQQEGGSKLANYAFKTLGITGSATDPIKGIKDLIGVKSRK